MKTCPFCAEEIQDAAIKCKHCREFLDQASYQKVDNLKTKTQVKTESKDNAYISSKPGSMLITDSTILSSNLKGLFSNIEQIELLIGTNNALGDGTILLLLTGKHPGRFGYNFLLFSANSIASIESDGTIIQIINKNNITDLVTRRGDWVGHKLDLTYYNSSLQKNETLKYRDIALDFTVFDWFLKWYLSPEGAAFFCKGCGNEIVDAESCKQCGRKIAEGMTVNDYYLTKILQMLPEKRAYAKWKTERFKRRGFCFISLVFPSLIANTIFSDWFDEEVFLSNVLYAVPIILFFVIDFFVLASIYPKPTQFNELDEK